MTKNNSIFLAECLRLAECGLSLIPIRPDGSKAPTLPAWKTYQSRRATAAELHGWFGAGTVGVAVVNGIVSGYLETLDFDELGLLDQWLALAADQGWGELVDTLPIVQTPSGGYHVYFRSDAPPPGNLKLARTTDRAVRIETRGEGGYALIPPSPAACHPDRKPYLYLRGHLALVPTLAAEERNALIHMAQVFNEFVEPSRETAPPSHSPRSPSDVRNTSDLRSSTDLRNTSDLRPGDDYNARGDWQSLLERHGWTRTGYRAGRDLWRRPGKARGISATSGFGGDGAFYVFSSNAAPFESETSYGPFAVYATLEHGGDWAAAAKALAAEGYGEPPKPRRPSGYDPPPPPPPSEEDDAPPPPDYHFTDLGNARRLMDRWGQNLRFIHAAKSWYVWDGTRWQRDETGAVHRYARETIASIRAQADRDADADRRDKLRGWALKCEAQTRMAAMVTVAQHEPEAPLRTLDLDQHPMLLNVANGTVDLATGRLRPHARGDLLSKIAPTAYLPDALCPTWDAFLQRILAGDEALVSFLQRAVGFALTGDSRRRVLVILHGNQGRNGKSTFIETIHSLLGDYALATPVEMLMAKRGESGQTNDLARLRGARFVSARESEEGQRLAEGQLKQMTGGDLMTARFLYEESFDFKPEFKLFLATNHKPTIRGTDEGLWDRLRMVPFEVRIPDDEVDENLPAKLLSELSGILAWAVRGCLAWQREGLGNPAAVEAATAAYRSEMDDLGKFLEDCCTLVPQAHTPATQIYKAYEAWCAENGVYCQKQTSFGRKLSDRGLQPEKLGGVSYRVGIGLTTAIEQDSQDS